MTGFPEEAKEDLNKYVVVFFAWIARLILLNDLVSQYFIDSFVRLSDFHTHEIRAQETILHYLKWE